MDARHAFMDTAGTLLRALTELSHYRIVGNTISIATLSVHVHNKDSYTQPDTPAIAAIRQISPAEFRSHSQLFNESSIIIAYSWLDTFLGELEEALFLHDPASLGESIQIKLGKVLSASSIDELVHDIAKRRTREKSQWGLKNRFGELRDRHGLTFSISDKDLEWISEIRNNLVHNRRIGEYKASKGQVKYESTERWQIQGRVQVNKFLSLTFLLLTELYIEGAKAIGVTSRFPKHKRNLALIESIQVAFPKLAP